MSENHPNMGMMLAKAASTAVSVLTLFGLVYLGISTVNGFAFDIAQIKTDNVQLTSTVNNLNEKIDTLNDTTVQLRIAVTKMEERYEALITRLNERDSR